ncbi:MAG: aminotransferase class I/II-fold pyridoxal phosphate-dependent enzyme [Acidimicrobiia bacterium]|nr:aminotransferase class I/II-fold pyridoxal phosphate-dependent enzyme [Acidimicrobiia bacterium]
MNGIVRFRERDDAPASDTYKWNDPPEGTIGASVADMDVHIAPPVASALHDAVHRSSTGYVKSHMRGVADSIADWHGRRFGQPVDPSLIRFAPNVVNGLIQAATVLNPARKRLIMNTPVYYPFFEVANEVEMAQVRVSMVEDDGRWLLDLDRMDAEAADGGIILLCNPHNPTGAVPTRAELEGVADIARRHGNPIISDEIHAPLTYPGHTFVPFSEVAPDLADRLFTVTSTSKSFNLPGVKFAWLIAGSPELAAGVDDLPVMLTYGTSSFGPAATVAATSQGDPWLDELVERLTERRDRLGELLAERLPRTRWLAPEATFLAWLDFRGYDLPEEPAAVLKGHGVDLSPGVIFGEEGRGHARLNFGCSAQTLELMVDRIATALEG